MSRSDTCALCEKLHKKGKFPKVCPHRFLQKEKDGDRNSQQTPTTIGHTTSSAQKRELWRNVVNPYTLAPMRSRLNRTQPILKSGSSIPRTSSFGSVDQLAMAGSLSSLPKDENSIKEFFEAVLEGDIAALKRMIMNGAKVVFGVDQINGRTALHVAAASGRLRVVEFLISENALVNAKDKWDLTPADLAQDKGFSQVVEYLQRNGATLSDGAFIKNWKKGIFDFVREGNLNALREILHTDESIFRRLLNDLNQNVLHEALKQDSSIDLISFLVHEAQVEINKIDANNNTPLDIAMKFGNSAIVDFLKGNGAENSNSLSGLLIFKLCNAAFKGDISEASMLLAQGADVNGTDYDERCPLHIAAANGKFEFIKFLVENGAQREVYDRWGCDPYQEAMKNKHYDIADFLDLGGRFSFKKKLCLDVEGQENDKESRTYVSAECCSRFGSNRETLHQALSLAIKAACISGHWDYGEFWTVDKTKLLMRCCQSVSYADPGLNKNQYRSASASVPIECLLFFSGRAIRNAETVWHEEISKVKQEDFPIITAASEGGFSSCVCIPVFSRSASEVLGCVLLFSRSPRVASSVENEFSKLSLAADVLALEALFASETILRDDYCVSLQILTKVEPSQVKDLKLEPDRVYSRLVSPRNSNQLQLSISLLLASGSLNRAISWGLSLESEDHKAALQILKTLASVLPDLPETLKNSILLEGQYLMCLKYLATVSPLEKENSPVRSEISQIIETLRLHGLFNEEAPYFGPGKERSPVMDELEKFKNELEYTLNNFVKKDDMLGLRKFDDPQLLEFPARFVFQACGQKRQASSAYSSRYQDDEHEKISKFATELLQKSDREPIITVENIKAMHRLLELESDVDPGNFRKNLVVGSHMFYRFYRTFAPYEEVEDAMHTFEQVINAQASEEKWNGVQKAFYVFAAIVMFIHPFEDGNGRIGRLFANMLLIAEGYPVIFQYSHKVITFGEILKLVWDKMNRLSFLKF